MMPLRKIERRVSGTFHSWERCRMQDLHKGDVFRMFEPDGKGRVGDMNYIAKSEPRLTPTHPLNMESNPEMVWGIEAEPYED